MKARTPLLAGAVATAFGTVALPGLAAEAQSDPHQIEEVVVTSSRVPIPLRQLGTSVSVITAADSTVPATSAAGVVRVSSRLSTIGM